ENARRTIFCLLTLLAKKRHDVHKTKKKKTKNNSEKTIFALQNLPLTVDDTEKRRNFSTFFRLYIYYNTARRKLQGRIAFF
ncbi:MAG: hypothetical protein IJX19_06925, partial [Clostridia bacterium]|nr:hypothetical protein [Clostridia bacterium]